MKSIMKKKLLPSMMAALAAGVGFSSSVQAIHLAEDGIGQVLMAPAYLGDYGFKSEVEIVNTNTNTAVKAKVVLRSQVSSRELLDFMCYLTPGDVCRFQIVKACGTMPENSDIPEATLPLSNDCTEENKYVFMYSEDDSIKSPVSGNEVDQELIVDSLENTRTTFASIKPVVRGLLEPVSPDMAEVGHIEVIGVYAVQNGNSSDGTDIPVMGRNANNQKTFVSIAPRMSKFALAQIFDTPRTVGAYNELIHRNPYSPLEEYRFDQNSIRFYNENAPFEQVERVGDYDQNGNPIYEPLNAPLGTLSNSRIRSTDPEWIRLMGTVEFLREDSTGQVLDRMAYRIPALAGSIGDAAIVDSNTGYYSTGAALGLLSSTAFWDGLVVSNPTYDVNVIVESGMGARFGIGSLSKTVEIEAALAATELQGTYHNDNQQFYTNLFVTFPTRYMHRNNNDWCNSTPFIVSDNDELKYTEPFRADGTVVYGLTGYDDFENPSIIGGVPFSPPRIELNTLVEVNYFLPEWPTTRFNADGSVVDGTLDYRKGWFRMTLSGTDTAIGTASGIEDQGGCPYVGLPVLGLIHKTTNNGSGYTNSQLLPLSHQPIRECGRGTVNPVCATQRQDYSASETGESNSNPNITVSSTGSTMFGGNENQ